MTKTRIYRSEYISVIDIDKAVAHSGALYIDVHSPSQDEHTSSARNLCMLKCREYLHMSTPRIARYYGKVSHTTVLSDLQSIRNRIETEKKYRLMYDKVDALLQRLRSEGRRKKQIYNLHFRLRQKKISINTKSKTVSIRESEMPQLQKGQLLKLLQKHNYAVQYSIL